MYKDYIFLPLKKNSNYLLTFSAIRSKVTEKRFKKQKFGPPMMAWYEPKAGELLVQLDIN